MFRGLTAVNLDPKGRMAMPVRYRECLQDSCKNRMVVTIDTEASCLLLYPEDIWETIEQKLETLPSFNPAARRIQRLLIGHATEVELDTQGRILLPPLLREYANLTKKALLVGQGKKFELWDEEHWRVGREQWLEETTATAADFPNELKILSL